MLSLPGELLQDIFRLTWKSEPDFDSLTTLLPLSHVNKHTRMLIMSDPVLWNEFHVGLSSKRTKGYANLSALVELIFSYRLTTQFIKTASLYKVPVNYSVVRDLLKLPNLETLNVQYCERFNTIGFAEILP